MIKNVNELIFYEKDKLYCRYNLDIIGDFKLVSIISDDVITLIKSEGTKIYAREVTIHENHITLVETTDISVDCRVKFEFKLWFKLQFLALFLIWLFLLHQM